DRIEKAASVQDEKDLYKAQLDLILDPHDPVVIEQAKSDGVHDKWLEAAANSPVYKMVKEWEVAFPLHPEFRTLPMVWYVPPLSPIQNAAEKNHVVFAGELPDVGSLQIPVKYLANMLTAGDEAPVVRALHRMFAMRIFMRDRTVEGKHNESVLQQADLTVTEVEEMYRYFAIANIEDRYVIPTARREVGEDAGGQQGACGI